MSIAAVDVQYGDAATAAACITFGTWPAAQPDCEVVRLLHEAAAYVPGEFWRRELPCILAALDMLRDQPAIVVVDGYVWLDAAQRPGLGARLFAALGSTVPVIGVAKTAFQGSAHAVEVQRGNSARPLYITAAGIDANDAAQAIRTMHGEYRIPTLLKRVDRLCRETLSGTKDAS